MSRSIIIAIDGYSSTGKSTLAKQLAAELGYGYVDTGAMYRAVTLFLLDRGISIENTPAVSAILPEINIRFRQVEGQNRTFLNEVDVEEEIRSMRVSDQVSEVATISTVRRAMVLQQQQMGEDKGIVMDGRDIGTVVFPKAALKIFLTADPGKRAQRRYEEMKTMGREVDVQEVVANLQKRDHIDSSRSDSPLKQATDAVVVDNTNLTREDQLAMVTALAKSRIKAASRIPEIGS